MPPTPLELLLPGTLDDGAALALFADRLDVAAGRARREDRVLLDSFDGRLRAAGLRAERPAGRAAAATISVHEHGAPVRTAEVPAGRRYLARELPPGPLRERLAPVLGIRALLPVVRVRSRVRPVAVLDGEAKTVVRLTIEHSEALVRRGEPVALAPRLRVAPVLGYDRAFARTAGALTDALGLAPAAAPLLDEAVAAAGGFSSKLDLRLTRGTRADEAAGVVLSRLADVAEANLPGTLDDLDTEFLHDLRVAVRRSRSLLRELRGVHPPAQRAALRTELRWVQALTGPVRDLDVQLLEWEELVAALPPGRRDELAPLRALLERRREESFRRLRRGLRGRRFAAARAAWRALAELPPADAPDRPRAGLPIEVVAADRIHSVYRRMVRDGAAIGPDSPPEALHELRKRGKELRYLLELFGSLFPGTVVKPMVRALKGLQDVLGRFQDRAVQAELLAGIADELAATPGGPAALMALGLAVEALHADQRAARASFADRFAAFAAREQRAIVRVAFPKLRA